MMSVLVHLKINLLAGNASNKYETSTFTCSIQICDEYNERCRICISYVMFSPSNLFKSRFQKYTNGEIISVQKNVPSLVQVKIRMDTLGFVAKTYDEKYGRYASNITMIEEG